MPTTIQPFAAESASVFEQRLEGLESMGIQVCSAIENLAESLVKLQQQVSARPDTGAVVDMAGLMLRIQQLELQSRLESTCADLARTSRFHPK